MNDYNIKKLYEEMEMHLIESMQRNLGRHLLEEDKTGFEYPQWQAIKLKELKRYQRENRDIIKNDTKGLSKYVSDHLQKELKQGSLNAIKEYNKHHDNKLSSDKLMTKSFFKVNDRKVNALIKSINDDLKTANTSALRMANDQYRQIIHKSAFFVGNGAFTEQQATKMAVKEISEKKMTTLAVDEASKNFLAGGLNCIEYKDGRKVNIASYAEMAIRTASLRTHLMGEGDFRKSIGRTLVQVTTHGESCDGCSNWEGKILVDDVYSGGEADGKHTLLSDAMAQGLFHPNCRHGLTTYYPELEGISYDTPETDIQEELQDKINYYTRQEKKYDRLSVGSLDSDNRKIYKQKELLYEKKKDEYIMLKKNMPLYDDITDGWLGIKNDKENIVIMHNNGDTFKYKGKEYKIDGNNIVLDYKKGEKNFVNWLRKKTNKRIEMFPRFNKPDGFKSADYKIGKEYFDYKHTTGSSSQLVLHNLRGKEQQANNFIIEITNEKIYNSNVEIKRQVSEVFRRYKWVKKIGIKTPNSFTMYSRI